MTKWAFLFACAGLLATGILGAFRYTAEAGCANAGTAAPACRDSVVFQLLPVDTDGDGIPDDSFVEVSVADLLEMIQPPPVHYSLRLFGQLPDSTRSHLTFNCEFIDLASGPGGTGHNVIVDEWDETGARDSCQVIVFLQDQIGICVPQEYFLYSGFIKDETNAPVPNIPVMIAWHNGSTVVQTNAMGFYIFSSTVFPLPQSASITPLSPQDYGNGVSTLDILLIQRHILAVQPLNSPYKYIAADVNQSGSITLQDLILLRQLILGVNTVFPNEKSWRFIHTYYQFPIPNNPWFESFSESASFFSPGIPWFEANFTAVKLGDVNGSAGPPP